MMVRVNSQASTKNPGILRVLRFPSIRNPEWLDSYKGFQQQTRLFMYLYVW